MQLPKHTKIHTKVSTGTSDAKFSEVLLKYQLPQATRTLILKKVDRKVLTA